MQQNGQPQNQQNSQKSGLSWSTPSAPATSTPKSAAPVTPVASPQKSLPISTASQTNMAGYIGTLAGGIVIGVLLAWGYSAIRGESTVATNSTNSAAAAISTTSSGTKGTTKTTTTSTPAASAATAGSVAATISSPQKAGMSVAVSSVTVGKPTWIVVYDNVNGKPGNALGAHLFFTTGSGTVTLLRATKAGTTYFVGTSIDNGDRKYAKATDKATTNTDGSVATVSFIAQ